MQYQQPRLASGDGEFQSLRNDARERTARSLAWGRVPPQSDLPACGDGDSRTASAVSLEASRTVTGAWSARPFAQMAPRARSAHQVCLTFMRRLAPVPYAS